MSSSSPGLQESYTGELYRAGTDGYGRSRRVYKDEDEDERRTSDRKPSRRDLESHQTLQYDEPSTQDRYSEGWEEDYPAGPSSLAAQTQEIGSTVDQLSPDFVVVSNPARFFVLGRVFKVLWTEPASANETRTDQPFISEVSHGQLSFTKFRRFVVLRGRLRSSLCLALHTYSGQGTSKHDVRAEDHAIVFNQSRPHPVTLPGETLNIDPFPLIFEHPGERIDVTSRLDFGRIYTIEHNVRVMSIGRISPEHLERLDRCFVETSIGTPSPNPPVDVLSEPLAPVNTASSAVPQETPFSNPRDGSDFTMASPRAAYMKAPQRIVTGRSHREVGKLDPLYKTRNYDYKEYFRPGRVFSTLWTTPFSQSSGPTTEEKAYMSNVTHTIYGERVHSKIRRFVVVRTAKNRKSCTCLPITTYDSCTQNGQDMSEFGFIYSNRMPKTVMGMDKQPLKVTLSKGAEKVSDMAVVVYSRIYTVEANVKVRDVGELDDKSKRLLKLYFKDSNFTESDDLPTEDPGPIPRQHQESFLAGVGGEAYLSSSEPKQGHFFPGMTPTSAGYQSSSATLYSVESPHQTGSYQGYQGYQGYRPSSSLPPKIPDAPSSSNTNPADPVPNYGASTSNYGYPLGPSSTPVATSSASSYGSYPSSTPAYSSQPYASSTPNTAPYSSSTVYPLPVRGNTHPSVPESIATSHYNDEIDLSDNWRDSERARVANRRPADRRRR